MAATFLWRGAGTALDLAADWTEAGPGGGQAPVAPGTADAATIDAVGALDATGTLAVAALTLAGTIGLAGGGAIAVGGAAVAAGTLSIAAGVTVNAVGRIGAPVTLTGGVLADATTLALFAPVSGSGQLAIGAGATLFAAAPVAAGVTAAFAGAAGTLELFSAAPGFAGTISGFASLDVLDIADAAFTGAAWAAGTLTLGGGGALALRLAGSYGGDFFLAQPDGMGGTAVTLATPTPLPAATAGTLTLAGLVGGSGTAAAAVAGGTVALAGSLDAGTLDAGGRLTVLPGATLAAGTVSLAGSLVAEGAVALGGAVAAAGTVAIGGGATLSGSGRIDAALADGGVLAARGGVLALFGAAAGGGTLAIGAGATLFAAGALGAGLTVAFGHDATLELADPAACAATPAGLAPGDGVDFGFVADPGSLALGADLAAAAARLGVRLVSASDGTGGTLVGIACFAAGTRIATPAGEVAVERLGPGDAVLTPEGARPLVWVGRQGCDAPEQRPVRLAAGCLGPGLPARDLSLSPEHAVLLGEELVRAVALLDRPGVARAAAGRVAYHHLALARHGLVLAEGAWAETFLPHDDAPRFEAEAGTRPLPGPPCRPRRDALAPPPASPAPPGPLRGHVERIVRDGALLRLEGWALDEAAPRRAVALEVRRDGAVLARLHANRWRADLERAGLGDGRCGFAAALCGEAAGLRVARIEDGMFLPGAV